MNGIRAAHRTASRLRHTKGSCYLTHGADSYDKKSLRKALRNHGKALIAASEALSTLEVLEAKEEALEARYAAEFAAEYGD